MGWLVGLLCVAFDARAQAEACTCPEAAPRTLTATPEPLDLNRASESQLVTLPGVGPARARAILAFREQHGGFRSVGQLLRIRGIGRAMLRRLRPLITVSEPQAARLADELVRAHASGT
jgi:competence protein ComEA